jgi:ubiquitin-conjugating enzyme E2 variant
MDREATRPREPSTRSAETDRAPGRSVGGEAADAQQLGSARNITRPLLAVAIVLAGALATWHAVRIAFATHGAEWAGVVVALLAGVLLADFLAGGVHWACDTWGDERTRWLGAGLIRSFRHHHHRPQAMLAHDWIEVNGEAATTAVGVFAVMTLDGPALALLEHPSWYAFAWSAIGASALSNQIHQWAHTHSPPRVVRKLQRSGLILSRRRHAPHHRAPCIDRYCITTGWMNPALDRTGFWRALERGIAHATGATPRAHEMRAARYTEDTRRATRVSDHAPPQGNPRESPARLVSRSLEENA